MSNKINNITIRSTDMKYYYKGVHRSTTERQSAQINNRYIHLQYPGGRKLIILRKVTRNNSPIMELNDMENTLKIDNDHKIVFSGYDTYNIAKMLVNPTIEENECYNTIVGSTIQRSVYTPTGSHTWECPCGVKSVQYLVVGGGGGGGGAYDNAGAGGGGGGLVLTGTISTVPGTSYTVFVGSGGSGGTANRNISPQENSGVSGESSRFGNIVAYGGTGGYRSRANAGVRAGGGSVGNSSTLTAPTGGGGGGGGWGGGGGGGMGSAGNNGTTGGLAGTGGSGLANSLRDGTAITYSAGGKGGSPSDSGETGSNGTANTGQGGGGGGSPSTNNKNGGNGGSGIVVIVYYI